MKKSPVDEILEQFPAEKIWDDLEHLSEHAFWPNKEEPDWVTALKASLRVSYYPTGAFVHAGYRNVAGRSIEKLKEHDAKGRRRAQG
jgi:hypothetical protein